MSRNKWLVLLFVAPCLSFGAVYSSVGALAQEQPLQIDIPTKLKKANALLSLKKRLRQAYIPSHASQEAR